MIRNLLMIILLLLPAAQNRTNRESVSLDSAGKWEHKDKWGEFNVYYGSATFEYDEDYWKKDFNYSIVIKTTTKNILAPVTIEFPFGKLTIHEAETKTSLYFSTIDEEEKKNYKGRTNPPSEAMKNGKENVVSILEDLFPTCNPECTGDYPDISATVYVKNSDFSVIMSNY